MKRRRAGSEGELRATWYVGRVPDVPSGWRERLAELSPTLLTDPVLASFGRVERALDSAASWLAQHGEGHTGDLPYSPAQLYVLASVLHPVREERHDDVPTVTRSRIFRGDLRVEGDLVIDAPCIVAGSVSARSITVGQSGILAAGGDVTARALSGDGWFVIAGDATATFTCGYYPDGMFMVRGRLRSQLTIFRDHVATVVTDESLHSFDFHDEQPDDDPEYLRLLDLVPPEACTAREHEVTKVNAVDLLELCERATTGLPILRAR